MNGNAGMAGGWATTVVDQATAALTPLADPVRAAGAYTYMKQVSPFLGISAPDRRRALRHAWAHLPFPTSDELGEGALALMAVPMREFHYAAYDLIGSQIRYAESGFLRRYGEVLLTTKPWWDTVDGLVSAMVSPLSLRSPDPGLIDDWSASGDRWLIRAAIGHQRGWKSRTETARVLGLCHAHWDDREFFIAKAIGWALRDLGRLDPEAVRQFLADHDDRNRVAIREARRVL